MDVEQPGTPPPTVEDSVGGDPACWAALLCPTCGAMPDSPVDRQVGNRCARCGEPYPAD